MLVADYRKQVKPTDFIVSEGELKEADTSIMDLVGKSKFVSPQQTSPTSPGPSLDSAVIVP
jgi:hypothetical protein